MMDYVANSLLEENEHFCTLVTLSSGHTTKKFNKTLYNFAKILCEKQ